MDKILFTSSSDGSFQVNTNFAGERLTNNAVNQAQAAFDTEMDRRLTVNENKALADAKDKLKPPHNKDPKDMSPDERRDALKQLGALMGKDNKAAGTSNRNPILADISDGLNNLGQAVGLGNKASGASGFVDSDGKFHPRTCFTAGTLVTKLKVQFYESARNGGLTPDAKYEEKVAIETIKAGDYVLSFDEGKKEKSYKKVTELFHHQVELLYNLEIESGEMIETTWNHPFYVVREEANNRSTSLTGGWVEAKDLKAGDKLLNASGNIVQLKSSSEQIQEESISVYNFEVEDTHTYYVGDNGVLVHNYVDKILRVVVPLVIACGKDQTCRNKVISGLTLVGISSQIVFQITNTIEGNNSGDGVDYEETNQRNKKNRLEEVPSKHTPPDATPIKPNEIDPRKPTTIVVIPPEVPNKKSPSSYTPNKNGSDVTPPVKTLPTKPTDTVINSNSSNEANTGTEGSSTKPGFFSEAWQGITNGIGNVGRFISNAGASFVNGLGRVGNYISNGLNNISNRVASIFQPTPIKMSGGNDETDDDEEKKSILQRIIEHFGDRQEEALYDSHRDVNIKNAKLYGKRFIDSDSGHRVFVNGNEVYIETIDGKQGVTTMHITKKNLQQRIEDFKWIPE